jgi:hypothetical protein
MVALKLKNFGGMIPAVDPRLLPDNMAELSENTWSYTGSIEGLRTPTVVHTLVNPLSRKVFRIPKQYYDKAHISDSLWLEFTNPNTDVIHSPTVGDTYNRYYWASSQDYSADSPKYNTKARIELGLAGYAGNDPFLLGIPAPAVAPFVSRATGVYILEASTASYSVLKGTTKIYYSRGYGQDADSFNNTTGVDDVAYELYGATKAISSLKGNVDQSATPSQTSVAKNKYNVAGQRAEMRYTTVQSGLRITISDTGGITLGVPTQPTAATSTNPHEGTGVQESRAYVYTWVSEYGEEGPPSPATLYNGWSGDPWIVQLTAPTVTNTTNRNLTNARIYRTVTGVGGATTYFFVAELPISQTLYTDTIDDTVVSANPILASTYWYAPPSDLEGMVAMPNGMIAGWRENEIWFCEPYRPHAWPPPYTLAVEFHIVGLGVIGQSLIVCTTGAPFSISGVNPASMSVSRITSNESCLSRGSIINTASGVIYASQHGLVLAVPGSAQVITRDMITKDHWLDAVNHLNIPSLHASILNGSYFCWGTVQPGCFEPTAFEVSAFLQEDFTGAKTGAIIDFTNQRVSYNRLTSDEVTYNCYIDTWTGETFVVRGGSVYWQDISVEREHGEFTWKSKILETPNKRSFEAMRVYFSTFSDTPELNPVPNTAAVQTLAADQWGLVRLYADGNLCFTREIRKSGDLFRLPSGFKATYWQIEIESRVQINSVEIATSAKELGLV